MMPSNVKTKSERQQRSVQEMPLTDETAERQDEIMTHRLFNGIVSIANISSVLSQPVSLA